MPVPTVCPTCSCPYHHAPPLGWSVRYGRYLTAAHGVVQRYRCRQCGHTLSDQSESLHFYAKRRLPLQAVWLSLLGGASLREIARRYHLSPPTVQRAILRLGRQAMAAQLSLLDHLRPCSRLVYDGLRSFIGSQDFPCDITTLVDPIGEVILAMSHSVARRGGSISAAQRSRLRRRLAVWQPEAGSMKRAISLLHQELWSYLRGLPDTPATIHTDEHPLYAALLRRDPIACHLNLAGALRHERTPSTAARTTANPLFPVNYIDRLLRHRLKDHARETIAFARAASMQMHRAWIFACDHNLHREYRVKQPQLGIHGEQHAVSHEELVAIRRSFFVRRLRPPQAPVPETIRAVWMGKVCGPPHRWKVGQRSDCLRIPAYAIRDLLGDYQHAG